MALLVTDGCIKCKYTDCVDVCPVDCFYEGESMLVIHPDECIDCGICEPLCPANAIVPDSYPNLEQWKVINREYSLVWPKITKTQAPLPGAETFKFRTDKYPEHFSAKPAVQTHTPHAQPRKSGYMKRTNTDAT